MQPVPQKPAIQRIVWTDYTAFFASSLPVAFWVIVLAWVPDWRGTGPVASPAAAPVLVMGAILTTLGAILVTAWRVAWFWSLFRSGKIVPGKIESVNFRRDRGRVEYIYAFHNQSFQARAALHRTLKTRKIKPGDHVTLLVDPQHPGRSFIRDLYL